MQKYVYEQPNLNYFINYVINKLTYPTPIKVHTALYMLWGNYAGTYGLIKHLYPKYLFPAEFKPFRHGPVLTSLYQQTNSDEKWTQRIQAVTDHENSAETFYHDADSSILNPAQNQELKDFFENILKQINDIRDFELAQLMPSNKDWQIARQNHTNIDLNFIKNYLKNHYDETTEQD